MPNLSGLPSDFATLNNLTADLKKIYEKLKQAIYSTTQQLNVKKALVCEYQHEVGAIRSNIAKQNKEIQSKILSAEGEINNARTTQCQAIEALESQLQQKKESVNGLKREIDIIKRNKKLELDGDVSPGINIDDLSAKNKALKENYACLEQELQLLHEQHAEVSEGLQNDQKLLEELTEGTELKKVELQEKEAVIRTLSDELYAATEQLKAYNSIPLSEHSKGNSLFAQVHDRCTHLEENVEQMKFQYKHLEQKLKKLERTIETLHKENNRLRNLWKTDLQQKQGTFKSASESLMDELTLMENNIDKVQLQLSEAVDTTKIAFSQVILHDKRREIFELGKNMSVQSKKVCDLAEALVEAKEDMRLLHFRALELQQQIEETQQKALLSVESQKCRRYTMFEIRD